jgi:hypothetical protein
MEYNLRDLALDRPSVTMPVLAAAVSIFAELPVAFAAAVGAFTRLYQNWSRL